jgi:hypothetical protein
MAARRGGGRRDTVKARQGTSYAKRDAKGRFVDLTKKGRSLKQDRRRKAKTRVNSGYGYRGDSAA